MAKQFDQIEPAHAAFIEHQHIFFTASAAATGRVNVSPRGTDAFRIVDPRAGLDIDLVQTSCGYGVPLFDYKEDRPTLRRWAEAKGEKGVAAYRQTKNVLSIDGFETGVPAAEPALSEATT